MPKLETVDTYGFGLCESIDPASENFDFGSQSAAGLTLKNYVFASSSSVPHTITGSDLPVPDGFATTVSPPRFDNLDAFATVVAAGEGAFRYLGLTDVSLPNLVTAGTNCFAAIAADAANLQTVDLPALTTLGATPFNGSTAIATFNAPNLAEVPAVLASSKAALTTVDISGAVTLNDNVFNGFTALATVNGVELDSDDIVVLPLVETLGASAFKGCTSLKNVSLPKLNVAGASAFEGCTGLVSVTATQDADGEGTLNFSGAGIFKGCVALATVTLPKLKLISSTSTFEGCVALATVIIPAVTTMGNNTFAKCPALDEIYAGAAPPLTTAANVFTTAVTTGGTFADSNDFTIYVPDAGAVTAWAEWKEFATAVKDKIAVAEGSPPEV
jgi:hypothetical protein